MKVACKRKSVYVHARPFKHRLYFVNARKSYATVEIHRKTQMQHPFVTNNPISH